MKQHLVQLAAFPRVLDFQKPLRSTYGEINVKICKKWFAMGTAAAS
jgi:hypothetical protein